MTELKQIRDLQDRFGDHFEKLTDIQLKFIAEAITMQLLLGQPGSFISKNKLVAAAGGLNCELPEQIVSAFNLLDGLPYENYSTVLITIDRLPKSRSPS